MELQFRIKPQEGDFQIPIDYRPECLSFIKRSIQQENEWLYKKYFFHKTIKPYTFALIPARIDRVDILNWKILCKQDLFFRLRVHPGYKELIITLYNAILKNKGKVEIFNQQFEIKSLWIQQVRSISGEQAIFKTISPVFIRGYQNKNYGVVPECVHNGFPGDDEFHEAFQKNIQEQVRAFLFDDDEPNVQFKPIKLKRVVVYHMNKKLNDKPMKLPCFTGTFELTGQSEILNLIQQIGLGSRRGQGFGMVEFIQKQNI
ncbi:MAG: CRISPR-associated endoribonuclease Cas6 [Thermoflavifilum sp.]|nr:CRISPR-associated endoribonuclease Cas6 [Thermoflavifilum sp.]